MRSVLFGILGAVVIALLFALLLPQAQRTAYQAFTSPESVRVGDPGGNLVGSDWTGNPGRDPTPGH